MIAYSVTKRKYTFIWFSASRYPVLRHRRASAGAWEARNSTAGLAQEVPRPATLGERAAHTVAPAPPA